MKAYLTKEMYVGPSICDRSGKLSLPGFFLTFGDLATQHADMLGIGLKALMPKDLFWVAVRTRLVIHDRPELGSTVSAATWPEKPEKLKSYRNYVIESDGRIFAEAKTEWAVLNMASGRPLPAGQVFPDDIEFCEKTVDTGAFSRTKVEFPEEPFGSFKVSSADIDVGRHMNNAFYVRSILGLFSNDELESRPPKVFEIAYRTQCYEGETVTVYAREIDGIVYLKGENEEKKLIFTAEIEYR